MSRDVHEEQKGSILAVSILSGLLAGLAILLTLSALDLPRTEAVVFSGLCGFTVMAFVYRERALTHVNDCLRYEHVYQVEQLEKRIHAYYENSVACLVYFDAGTLLVEKASPGFLQLLRVPPEKKVLGQSIVELLHVSTTSIEQIVSEIQSNGKDANSHRMNVEDSYGAQLSVEITAKYFRRTHMVEAAFFVPPIKTQADVKEVDIARKDLDRFRRGMYNRETRILELKEEVNKLLEEAGRNPRYRFDRNAKDSNFSKETYSDSGGGV